MPRLQSAIFAQYCSLPFLLAFFSVFTMGASAVAATGNGASKVAQEEVVFAVNCGGPEYVDKKGIVYRADTHYSSGQTYKTTAVILGTEDGFLYQTERWGKFSYNLPLVNGDYKVTLKFAEIYEYAKWTGMRLFNVKVEGKQVISNLDLVAKAGQYKAYDVTLPVKVADGVLNIEFYNTRENAKASAILVTKEGPVLPENGMIRGRATESLTKLPILQAMVSATDSSNIPKSVPTDQNGMYEIRDISPGGLVGEMKKDGYEPYSFQRNISPGEILEVNGELKPILPVLSKIEARDLTTDTVKIYWETDQEADSLVEYGETPSYGKSESDSPLTKIHQVPLKNLKAGTEYHYKVTSKNKYGFPSSSGDKTFTSQALSSPIKVKITYPADGSSISNSTTRVEGTVVNSLGYETGVMVNGVLAVVHGDQFLVNQIPLTERDNTIVAVATDVKGNQTEDTLNVKSVSSENYINITANQEWGLSPLETVLTLDSSLDLANAEITFIGPGEVEWLAKIENEYTIRIAAEGAYVFTASVADGSGIRYIDTLSITVLSKAEIESRLTSKWEGMKEALVSGNIEAGLDYFVYGSRDRYRQLFMELGEEKIRSIFSNIMEIKLYSSSEGFAKCGALRRESGGIYSYPVTFVQDGNGIWKIMGF